MEMDHDDRVICRSSNGAIFRCSCCSNIHVEFGNVSLCFRRDGLKVFYEQVHNIEGKLQDGYGEIRREICIEIRGVNVKLLFNRREILELYQLLSEAEVRIALGLHGYQEPHNLN